MDVAIGQGVTIMNGLEINQGVLNWHGEHIETTKCGMFFFCGMQLVHGV